MSILRALIFFGIGQILYLLPALLGQALSPQKRLRIGRHYFKQSLRCFERLALIRRRLSGYTLLPIGVDDERRWAQVTLDSGMLSDAVKLPFRDPADLIHRLYNKPVTIVPGALPAAVDLELAEAAHWVREHKANEGFVDEPPGGGKPSVSLKFGIPMTQRACDPLEALGLRSKSTEPEEIETIRKFTKARFEKYASNIGAAETIGVLTGFMAGAGGVAGVIYIRDNIINDTGPSSPTSPVGNVSDPQQLSMAIDVVGQASTQLVGVAA